MAAERSVKRAVLSGASFLCVFSIILYFPAVVNAAVASVSGLDGDVYLMEKGANRWTIAVKGSELDVGDTVKTGSGGRVTLYFADGSRLSLGNDSELRIKKFYLKRNKRKAVYSLSTGKLRAFIKGFTGRSDIKVRTPTSVSGVKGTDFIVMNRGKANVIFGEGGEVLVSGDDSGGVALTYGAMTENTSGTKPIEPVAVEPGSALEDIRAGLEAVTDVDAPVEWEKAGMLPDIMARWNINYGHYLADSRLFDKAMEVLRIAIDLTLLPEMKAEAHMERGSLLSRNLDDPRGALKEYAAVMDEYPVEPYLENAVFSAGMVNMDIGRKRRALNLFNRYLNDYPEGRHTGTVEILKRGL